MKKALFCIMSVFITALTIDAQPSISFDQKTLIETRGKDYEKITQNILIKVDGPVPPGKPVPVVLNILSDDNYSYTLEKKEFIFNEGFSGSQNVRFTIKGGKPVKDTDTVTLSFIDPLNPKETRKLNIYITAEEEPAPVNLFNSIMFLNAYNFDFSPTKLNSNYVGHLNLFAPNLSKKKHKWGFNAGIMKIDYSSGGDSGAVRYARVDSIALNPFSSANYARQLNEYNITSKNSSWSFYIQPLFEITSDSKQHIYWHVHLELYSTKYTTTTLINTLKTDTVYGNSNNKTVLRSGLLNSQNNHTANSLSGYFGTGATFNLSPWKGSQFFFQPTIGLATNNQQFYISTPTLVTYNNNLYDLSSAGSSYMTSKTFTGFYLLRAQFMQLIGSGKSSLVVGGDIRGFLPFYSPHYAFYTGLNVGVDEVLKLISK